MRFFLTAGEASGDALGAALIAGLRQLDPDLEIMGVGGPLMAAEGLSSLFPMEELSVMGIAEILPRYRNLKRRIDQTAAAAVAARPDALITIDSPDFSWRVARTVRSAAQIHTIHYVAPTVWAWRLKRAKKLKPLVDHVLALFPFEPPYFEAEGIRCTFVGHPIATAPQASDEDVRSFREHHATGDPMVLVLPGSRHSEVQRLLPIFGDVIGRAAERYPRLTPVIPALASRREEIERHTSVWRVPPVLINAGAMKEKQAAFRAADVALTKSGTVSLELAAAGTPMIVAHDMNWLSRQIIARMLRVDTVTLVNLVTETRVVPEFLGSDCKAEFIFPALVSLLEEPRRQETVLGDTMMKLGRGGIPPGLRAARAVLEGIGGL